MHPDVMLYEMGKVWQKHLQEAARQKVDAAVNTQQRGLSPQHEGRVQMHMDKMTSHSTPPGDEKPSLTWGENQTLFSFTHLLCTYKFLFLTSHIVNWFSGMMITGLPLSCTLFVQASLEQWAWCSNGNYPKAQEKSHFRQSVSPQQQLLIDSAFEWTRLWAPSWQKMQTWCSVTFRCWCHEATIFRRTIKNVRCSVLF
jgi:hypothetical protein